MSTKIYTGIEFKQTEIGPLLKSINSWRAKVKILTEEDLAAKMAKLFAFRYDKLIVNGGVITEAPFREVKNIIEEEQKEAKKGFRSEYDYGFDVSIHPHFGKLYGMIFTEQREWIDLFKRHMKTKDFSYWDNTDKPNHLSQKVWDQRGKVWDKIFYHSSIPSRVGLTAECGQTPIVYAFSSEKVLQAMPSFEYRIKNQVDDFVRTKFINENLGGLNNENVFHVIQKSNEFMKSDEGLEQRLSVKEVFEKLLIPTITKKELLLNYAS